MLNFHVVRVRIHYIGEVTGRMMAIDLGPDPVATVPTKSQGSARIDPIHRNGVVLIIRYVGKLAAGIYGD